MKIENLNQVNPVTPEESQKTRRTESGSESFQQILAQEAFGIQPGSQVSETAAASVFTETVGAAVGEHGMSGPWVGMLGGALDQLSAACFETSGAGAPLEAIAQALTDLGQAADEAMRRTQTLPEDHPLRRTALEARVLAYVESVKWRRGDYL